MKYLTLLIVTALMFACNSKPEYLYKKRVVVAKSQGLRGGTTSYQFAYEDQNCDYVDFGLYSTIKEKDTVYMQKENEFLGVWHYIDKKDYLGN